MAITSSAKKAIRVAARRRVFNLRRKAELQKALKGLKRAIKSGKKAEAEKDAVRVQTLISKCQELSQKLAVMKKKG